MYARPSTSTGAHGVHGDAGAHDRDRVGHEGVYVRDRGPAAGVPDLPVAGTDTSTRAAHGRSARPVPSSASPGQTPHPTFSRR
jgi:hypothetical protein